MKIYIKCETCLEIARKNPTPIGGRDNPPGGQWFVAPPWLFEQLREGLKYSVKCSEGHVTEGSVVNPEFEILFDSATLALIDGYYREAIGTYSSALERFYEFYIKIVCKRRGLDDKQVNAAWKHVESSSERQHGSFRFVYLMHTNKDFLLTTQKSQKMTTLRNNVTHKGRIANEEDALAYGEYVYDDIIIPTLMELRDNNTRDLRLEFMDHPGRDEYANTMLHVYGLLPDQPRFRVRLAQFEQTNGWLQPSIDRTQIHELAWYSPHKTAHEYLKHVTNGAYSASFRYARFLKE